MSIDGATGVAERVRALAEFLSATDAVSVRIDRENDTIELVRRASSDIENPNAAVRSEPPLRVDTIKADLVGIFHLGRPVPVAGETLDGDRELGFIEALGIRTPVRSLGAGRIVTIAIDDGYPVEYGQPLFSIARG
jgi:biotin carboxyl carrier protein